MAQQHPNLEKENLMSPRDSTEPMYSTDEPRPSLPDIAPPPAEDCGCGPPAVDAVVNNDLPTKADLEQCADIPIIAANGSERPFKNLYTGPEAPRRNLIVFVRHFFCGMCQQYLQTLVNTIPPSSLPPSTHLTIIGCGDPTLIPFYSTTCHIPPEYALYVDPTRKLYDALHMTRTLAIGSKPQYQQTSTLTNSVRSFFQTVGSGKKMLSGGDFWQVGGEFLFERNDAFDNDAKVTWCHRMRNTRDHAEMGEMRRVLDMGRAGSMQEEKEAQGNRQRKDSKASSAHSGKKEAPGLKRRGSSLVQTLRSRSQSWGRKGKDMKFMAGKEYSKMDEDDDSRRLPIAAA